MKRLEKDFDYFHERFRDLAQEAREHGVTVVVLFENADPISLEAGYAMISFATPATETGLLHMALDHRFG